jgi:DHA1 family bicyclomycin/chloramphenicol resistance-like MFS transporter
MESIWIRAISAAIFLVLATYGLAMLVWSWIRLPETLHPKYRRSLRWAEIIGGIRATLSERQSVGYTVAQAVIFGGLTAYIASIQQIVFDVFHAPAAIGIVFAGVAAPMTLASWYNSKVVMRYGLRHVGHLGVIAFVLVTSAHALLAELIEEPLWLFVLMQSMAMAAFALTSSNLSTLAMEHMAPIAGTASSVQGIIGTIGGASIGLVIGQAFDGTQIPFLVGIAGCGIGGLLLVLLTEKGRLVRDPPQPTLLTEEQVQFPE